MMKPELQSWIEWQYQWNMDDSISHCNPRSCHRSSHKTLQLFTLIPWR